jgi:hypothetical protein
MSFNEYRVCPKCGNFSLAQERQHFCVWCGTKLIGECQQCSKPILYPHGRFCYHCGSQYGFAIIHHGFEQRLVNASESTVKVWVGEEGRTHKSQIVPNDPHSNRKV